MSLRLLNLLHAVKLQKKDEDIVHAYNLIHSVISDIAIFRENIEKDFHDWFMDASRIGSELGIVLTVPRLSGRLMQVQKIRILKFITELMWQFHSWITWNKN